MKIAKIRFIRNEHVLKGSRIHKVGAEEGWHSFHGKFEAEFTFYWPKLAITPSNLLVLRLLLLRILQVLLTNDALFGFRS